MNRNRHLIAILLFALTAVFAAACSQADGPQPGQGMVQAVQPEAGKVTIDHGDIPGMMKAMTMTFDVADPAMLEGIEAGQHVEFELLYEGGKYTVTSLEAH